MKYTARVRIDHTFVLESDEDFEELAENYPHILDSIVLLAFEDLEDWGNNIEIETWKGEFI